MRFAGKGKREISSAAAPCVAFPAGLLAAARGFGIMIKCFRAGFNESGGGVRQAEADDVEKEERGQAWVGLLVLGSLFAFLQVRQGFLDDSGRTLFDIVIQFRIQIDGYGWHLRLYKEGFSI